MRPLALAFGWMLFVLVLLSIPGSSIPPLELGMADKLAHFACFFVIGLLWMRALRGSGLRRALITLAIGVLYGFGTEIYQALMPIGRTFDPYDAVADAAGTLAAIATWFLLRRKKGLAESNSESFTMS